MNEGKGNRLAVCEESARFFGVEYQKTDNTLSNSLRGAEKEGNKVDLFLDTLKKALGSYISELAVTRDERAARAAKKNKQLAKKDAVIPKQSRK